MTLEDAKKVLDSCTVYLDWEPGAGIDAEICIDGWLTLNQLKAVMVVAKHDLISQVISGPDLKLEALIPTGRKI